MADSNLSVNGASVGTADKSTNSSAAAKGKRRGSTLRGSASSKVITPKLDETKILELVKTQLTIKHSFGSSIIPNDGLQVYNSGRNERDLRDRLMYKVGRQLCILEPESNEEKFIVDRRKDVTDVLHFTISDNKKHLSVCESLKNNGDDIPKGRVTIYSLNTLQVVKHLNGPNDEEFIVSMFCGDPKMIAAYTEGNNERLVVIWQWEKERIHKTHLFTVPLSKIRCAPSATLMLTTTGPNHIKVWFLGSDGLFKSGNLLPAAKENENFIDHIWLPSSGGIHKMIALIGHDSKTTSAAVMSRQIIQIFEGGDAAQGHVINAPISLNMVQTEVMKVDGVNGVVATAIVASQKGFALVGANGFIAVYERADDRKYPYAEIRRLKVGSEHFICGALSLAETYIYVVSNTKRLLSIPVDAKPSEESTEQNDNNNTSTEAGEGGLDLFKLSGATELQRGFHLQPILCADMARGRPLIATISADQSCRIWNYETLTCDLINYFRTDESLTLSMHPSGFQMLISFKDRIKLFNILIDRLQGYQEVILKNCKEAKFSNGGQFFAAVSSINVNVYETTTGMQVASFQGHTMTVRRLSWAPGDQVIFSAGMDGNIYGWPVAQEGRLDILSNSRGSAICDMIVDCTNTSFPKNDHLEEEGLTLDQFQSQSRTLVLSSIDGHMKMPEWSLEVRRETRGNVKEPHIILGDEHFAITALCLSSKRDLLYAGTKSGSVRVYAWPPTGDAAVGAYLEYHIHNAPVVSIKESPVGNTLVSVAEDGSVFVYTSNKISEKEEEKKNEDELLLEDEVAFNNTVVMISVEQMEENIQAIVDLKKQLQETNQKHSFQEHRRESEFAEQLKGVVEKHEYMLTTEKSKAEKERTMFEGKVRDLLIKIENAETEQVKVRAEVENRYEHRLAEQLDRYDR